MFNVLTPWYDDGNGHAVGADVPLAVSRTESGLRVELKGRGGADCTFEVVGSLEAEPPDVRVSSKRRDDRSGSPPRYRRIGTIEGTVFLSFAPNAVYWKFCLTGVEDGLCGREVLMGGFSVPRNPEQIPSSDLH